MIKKLLLAAALFLICLFVLAVYMSSGSFPKIDYYTIVNYNRATEKADSTFSVITYNIGYMSGMTNNQSVKREEPLFDANLIKAKELFSAINPDLVGFQEIDFGSDRSFTVNQLDSLTLAAEYSSAYRSVNWDKNYVPFPYWPPSNHFGRVLSGQAILSRFPVNSGETIVLPPDRSTPLYYQAFYIDRLLQIAEVDFSWQKVMVMNVHLEAYNRETRLEQIEIVKAKYEEYADRRPVILMGDFNSEIPGMTNGSDAIEVLMNAPHIRSAIPFDLHSENNTYSSLDPVRMIDYIFYNENFLKCDSAAVLQQAGNVSDHLPVWGKFKLANHSL